MKGIVKVIFGEGTSQAVVKGRVEEVEIGEERTRW